MLVNSPCKTISFYDVILCSLFFISCNNSPNPHKDAAPNQEQVSANKIVQAHPIHHSFFEILADSALTLTQQKVTYDPAYYSIPYPNGDVPADKGVCCDVIIRAYRKINIDLQKLVHEDMKLAFSQYPHTWGLSKPDKNIDHRRVPNLMEFFKRKNASLPITNNPNDYLPGDIVTWDMGKSLPHIGIVVNEYSTDKQRHMMVHNVGGGQVLADYLFWHPIVGHYRYKEN